MGQSVQVARPEDIANVNALALSTNLSIEDTGDAFFIISEGEGHDLTLSLDPDLALRLAHFILSRRGGAALGGRE